MSTVVVSNGSKYAGQDPDPIGALLDVLGREPLDPDFERYGDFVMRVEPHIAEHYGVDHRRAVHVWGNFFQLSHSFSIFTDDEALVAQLVDAVRANKATDAYAEAKRVRREQADARRATLSTVRRWAR